MASTFSPILRIELIGTGDQSGTWGDTTNVNLGTLIEQAIAGTATIDVSIGNVTLTNFNGTTDQARCAALRVIGTPGTSRNIIAPAVSKLYVVANGSDAAVVLKTSTSTGLTVPVGEVYLAYYDPTVGTADFRLVGRASATTNTPNTLVLRDGSGNFAAGTITAVGFSGPLTGNVTGNVTGNASTVTNGVYTVGDQTIGGNKTFSSTIIGNLTGNAGTVTNGVYTEGDQTIGGNKTFSSTILGNISGTLTGTIASTTVATTQATGTNNTLVATTAFVQNTIPSGVILMWSGSIASIPAGWVLCNGLNGTPDLRDRFVAGAGITLAVGATGGSADAVVVAHTHSASSSSSSSVSDPGHAHNLSVYNSGGGPLTDRAQGTFGGFTQTLTTSTQAAVTGISVSTSTSTSIGSTGSSGVNANLPPYYALAFIMKS